MRRLVISIISLCMISCVRAPRTFEPTVTAPPHPKEIQRERRCFLALPQEFSVSPFPALTEEEACSDWGKEYRIGLMFAADFDLFRAITNFKSALCLMPPTENARHLEVQYAVTLAYFLGKKYIEVAYSVESTDLVRVDERFPAYTDLLMILYESYCQLGKEECAAHILNLLQKHEPSEGAKITLYSALRKGDFKKLEEEQAEYAVVASMLSGYRKGAKSIKKAEMLNALFPGAGYWYLGQKQTAITSILVNSLFAATAAHFFAHGNNPAGILTLSIEGGWYFGGIYGAGLSAKHYNEKLYSNYANKVNQKEHSFPLMRLKYSF
ncbi:MAG: hypothetical protein ACKVOH_03735 [Chlamydiales bacterium]